MGKIDADKKVFKILSLSTAKVSYVTGISAMNCIGTLESEFQIRCTATVIS